MMRTDNRSGYNLPSVPGQYSCVLPKKQCDKIKIEIFKLMKKQQKLRKRIIKLEEENEKILELTKETVRAQKTALESAVNNGVINVSELDNLDAELLKLDQQIIELSSQKKQLINAISELTGIKILDELNKNINTSNFNAALSISIIILIIFLNLRTYVTIFLI